MPSPRLVGNLAHFIYPTLSTPAPHYIIISLFFIFFFAYLKQKYYFCVSF
ncbi:hypothetical protein HMPREF9446_00148 [Bacteroides fluxus YIT 12057]|uniref:Uncharacterized protein n=1 Tax=Bacteroides fluxus YIT 12057 TaxID=763034 RepID=F3PN62_9BACE|nr:hypothetical protein HMPREF9446_00148 [Bacteroides fluxus YIT 12057]